MDDLIGKGWIVLDQSGERVGACEKDGSPLPAPDDLLILGFPDEGQRTYRVTSREHVNGEWYVIVKDGRYGDSVAARHVTGTPAPAFDPSDYRIEQL